MFLSLSFSLSLSSRLRPLPPPDLPLCSPHRLLQCNIDPEPDLKLYLNLVVESPEVAVLLDLFLLLLWGYLELSPDLVLALQ